MIVLQVQDAVEILSIESVSVIGLLLGFIFYIIWIGKKNEEKHEKEKEYLRSEIRLAQDKLDEEFKATNVEMKKVSENYHVFTTQVFNRLNDILNKR